MPTRHPFQTPDIEARNVAGREVETYAPEKGVLAKVVTLTGGQGLTYLEWHVKADKTSAEAPNPEEGDGVVPAGVAMPDVGDWILVFPSPTEDVAVAVPVPWAGSGGGGAAGGCGWLAELVNIEALWLTVVSAAGMCECIATDQFLLLVPGPGGGEWVVYEDYSPLVFEACTGEFTVKFTANGCEPPCLSLTTTTGSGETTYNLYFDFCVPSEKSIVFAGSGPVFCDGDPTPCVAEDVFRLKVRCAGSSCPADETACPDLPAVLHITFTGGDCDCYTPGVPITLAMLDGLPSWRYRSNACPGYTYTAGPLRGFNVVVNCIDEDGTVELQVLWENTTPPVFAGFHATANVNDPGNSCSPLYVAFAPVADGGGGSPIGGPCPSSIPTLAELTL